MFPEKILGRKKLQDLEVYWLWVKGEEEGSVTYSFN